MFDSLAKFTEELSIRDNPQYQWRPKSVDSWRSWKDLEQLAILPGFHTYGRRIFHEVFEISNVLTRDFTIQIYIIQQAHKYYMDVKDDLRGSEYYNKHIQLLSEHTAPQEEDRAV